MNRIKSKSKFLVVLCGTIFLLLFIANTNPRELSAGYLLVPPLTVFLVFYNLAQIFLSAFTKMANSKKRLISLMFSLGPLAILLLASMGQLTSRDTILSIVLMIGLAFYFAKAQVVEGS